MKEPLSIQQLIISSLRGNEKIIFNQKKIYRTEGITGDGLFKKICSFRHLLNSINTRKNDRVLILGYPSVEWVVAYFGCILSGVIIVPLDIYTDKKLLHKISLQIKPKAVFVNRSLKDAVGRNAKTFYLEELYTYLRKLSEKELPLNRVKGGDTLEIQYTSGTTGDPKGVILTHINIFSGVKAAADSIRLKLGLRFLNTLPLSHVFAQIMGIFLPIYYGYNIFFIDTGQPRKIASFIRNKRINAAIFVPSMLISLKRYLEGKSVIGLLGMQFKIIGVGGASLDAEIERWWRNRLIFILQGYGMTETSSVISLNSPLASRKGSVGKISRIVDFKLGEDNEIMVKGPNVTPGYYMAEDKTKQSFDGGWFKTGDIGEIKNGYLYIKERKKDIIVTEGGLKVYPADIEKILNSMQGVKDSCIIQKDSKVHAVIILKEKSNANEIIKNTNAKLLPHQKIAGFSIWPEPMFPKTPTGKIKKFLVMKALPQMHAVHKKASYDNKFQEVVDNVLKPEGKIKNDAKLVELGMDSLKRIELIAELEKAFDVEIDEAEIDQHSKVKDLEKKITERQIVRQKFRRWPAFKITRSLGLLYVEYFLSMIVGFFTNTKYEGIENLQKLDGQVIFISNHQSAFDIPVIARQIKVHYAVAADANVVFGIGLKGLQGFFRKILGYYSAFAYNAYPFGAAIGTDTSLEFTGEMLDRGYSIILFPEGERTRDGKIHEFKAGIGYIVANMKVPISPLKIEGLFEIFPRGNIIPKFGKTKVVFGKQIVFDENKLKKMSYGQIAELLEKKVRELYNDKY